MGSAITFYADAEKEYEECFLKAKGIFEVLKQKKDGSRQPSLKLGA